VARRAGKRQATVVTSASTTVEPPKQAGSVGSTEEQARDQMGQAERAHDAQTEYAITPLMPVAVMARARPAKIPSGNIERIIMEELLPCHLRAIQCSPFANLELRSPSLKPQRRPGSVQF
jgi:hypothetical protein